ncbi:MAG TPA: N-acetylmuramoyl-L-alanine amidase [Bacteroidales bacterium]|jgi:N-acetylmuramoyl-L-alanine amidase|nr:N-acetylmuramoyl-L-alanine amidase [Bacteroidales bacterium]
MNKKYPLVILQALFIFFYVFFLSTVIVMAQPAESGYRLKTVVIDAGHGGKDPGSLGKKTTESKVVLGIALKLGKYIEQNLKEVKVIYTRKTDEFVELHKRAEIANTNKADLFISIHANGNDNHQVTGTETLVLGTIRAGENFEVAKKENSVILLEDNYQEKYEGFDPSSPESYQSFSLVQDLYLKKSVNFAALVQEQFRDRAQRKDRSVKQQSLLVLARTAMPGVLIETGFITNPDEEKYLMSEQGQDYLASAIYRAFRDYKDVVESRSSLIASLGKHPDDDSVVSVLEASTSPVNNPENISDAAPADVTGQTNVQAEFKKEAEIVSENISKPEIYFKVQIAASTRRFPLTSTLFKGEKDVKEYIVGKMYKYAVGQSKSFEEIVAYSKEVRQKFPDAFVIAIRDNEIIPLQQALKENK